MPRVLPTETPTLGDRSYLVHDGQVASDRVAVRDDDVIAVAEAQRELVRIGIGW
ncbi:MAG: hypothetical protein HYR62_06890 [Actinobacteria bacterium]|nr:hypothetical protein [Actinomycetota bacterium]MBI3688310.1 hypothetical protein [Actinomycetota bacterium]